MSFWLKSLIVLPFLFLVCFTLGGLVVHPFVPRVAAEPGPLPAAWGLILVAVVSAVTVELMILGSRWRGWKLTAHVSLSTYGLLTVLTQMETWFFLYGVTVGGALMPRLFLQGLPVACVFVPLAVVVLGRARSGAEPVPAIQPAEPVEWLWKLAVLTATYLVLYFAAGHYVAWQNPELRAFYGQPGPALSFVDQMTRSLEARPGLIPFQVFRALLWVVCALPIVWGSRWGQCRTALVVAMASSVPQNVVHILPNPLIPAHSVRMSHLLETAPSSFLFGLILGWLLYPRTTEGGPGGGSGAPA